MQRKENRPRTSFGFSPDLSSSVFVTKYHFGDTKNEVRMVCSSYGAKVYCIQNFGGETRGKLLGKVRRGWADAIKNL